MRIVQKIIKEVKNKNPTVGFLNPPYKKPKSKDRYELEFILNNLDCLVAGGTCVAIVPLSSATGRKSDILELKEKLLEKHTLEAVLSMPNELFINSKVNVVTCIMVFTAKKPHPENKENYFGYYKDDGFVKKKGKGMIDANKQWGSVKKKWLVNFMNKNVELDFSVNKIVTASSEWVAEQYMKTNYSNLSNDAFIQTQLNYVTYLLSSRLSDHVYKSTYTKNNSTLNITTSDWKSFKLSYLFEITGSKTTPLLDLEEYGRGQHPYVTTQATNNGIKGFYDHYTERGNVLTIESAVLGYCSYQGAKFSASDHVEKMIPRFTMNKYIAMFLVTILNLERYRYNYGRKCSQTRMEEMSIKLPFKNEEPDFEFMESYIKSLPYSASL